ncbi:MAG: FAD-binding oxidoreductase, partial [Clostridia bacterium]|nr:FAD-binding oxidoreductase [Clostridia bacterium]
MKYDKIVIGAGLYGLYAALYCARRGQRVLVLEKDAEAFARATYINQARVHMGYHYPRSLSTAQKSAGYFHRFMEDFGFCVKRDFHQVYATSARHSWTNAEQFVRFCQAADIRCDEINPNRYFQPGLCDGAFLTTEYTYDAHVLREELVRRIGLEKERVTLLFSAPVTAIRRENEAYAVFSGQRRYDAPFVLNAAYAGTNEIGAMLGLEPFRIKYELCEIILCDVGQALKDVGLTVMDGPFFSLMPFGLTGMHSLTSVCFTPHKTSYDALPTFECQKQSQGTCRPDNLQNCNGCIARPQGEYNA